ncbi:MAG TPA: hypothetical protein VFZ52_20810 [Chryseolinea sp.]
MKNLKLIVISIAFLIAGSSTDLMAQRRNPGNTSSARAAYGFPTGQYKAKKKQKKQKKQRKAKTRKKKSGGDPAYRKKNPWVN